MRKVEDIERQIQELSRDEFSELRDWILKRNWKTWDAQIAADANAGKFDKLEMDSEIAAKTFYGDGFHCCPATSTDSRSFFGVSFGVTDSVSIELPQLFAQLLG